MTINDKLKFGQCFNRLAVALREDIDAPKMAIYFDALIDLPLEAVEAGAASLMREAQWFPKTSEWREVAERARHAKALKMALPDPGRGWSAECGTCDDTGWEIRNCTGQHRECGRPKEHPAHTYAESCPCRPTNRTYQRRRLEQQERSKGRHDATRRGKSEFTRVGE